MSSVDDREDGNDAWIYGAILSDDPLIVITKFVAQAKFGLASVWPNDFADRKCLHLIVPVNTVESPDYLKKTVSAYEEASRLFPQSRFVILTNSEYESYLLGRERIPVLFANQLIYSDERTYHPIAGLPTAARFDAVYNARFDAEKRHELCGQLDSIAFVYGQFADRHEANYLEAMERFPGACFANHEKGGGTYAWLSHEEINILLNRSRTGLCLSPAEEAMRASMEYLLSGLPIVSTESIGGRDRYFCAPYCAVVPADPDAVAYGVRRMIERNFRKEHVRAHVEQLLTFDRHNFLLNLNKIVRETFGVERMFANFEPFVGRPAYARPAGDIFEEADRLFGARWRKTG